MSVTVKRADLWRVETTNRPGALASTLAPFADSGANLDIVMGYAQADKSFAAIEVFPVRSEKGRRAARTAGLKRSDFPCVVISGNDRPGLGHTVAVALADAGINLNFCVAQTLGKQYTGLFSFEAASEADLAVRIIRRALALAGKSKGKKSPSRPPSNARAGRKRPANSRAAPRRKRR